MLKKKKKILLTIFRNDNFFTAYNFFAFAGTNKSVSILSNKASHTPQRKWLLMLRLYSKDVLPLYGVSEALMTLHAYSLNKSTKLDVLIPWRILWPRICCCCFWDMIVSFKVQQSNSKPTKLIKWFRSFCICIIIIIKKNNRER